MIERYKQNRFIQVVTVIWILVSLFFPVFSATLVGKGTSAKTSKGDLRIVFPLSEKTTFTSFRLENPARLVIDIPQAQLRQKATVLPIKGGAVQGIRLGTQQGTDLRIVVDMNRAMPASTALVRGRSGYELVILVNQSGTTVSKPIVVPGSDEKIISAQTDIQVAKLVKKQNVLIVIDPGHGGKDPGALGPKGTREKMVVLQIAQQLKKRIDREPGMRAVLTRNNDRFIPLRERVLIARRQKADMFVSIHADAGSRTADGASVYILSTSGASSEAARLLAEKENMSDMVGGVKISDKDNAIASMLLDISQDATIEASHELGKYILNHLQKHARLHKKNVERAGFAVLKAPDIPSVLVETGFISNPAEERKLTTSGHQAKLAEDIVQGIKMYYQKRPATEMVFSTVKAAPPVQVATKQEKAAQKKPVPAQNISQKVTQTTSVNLISSSQPAAEIKSSNNAAVSGNDGLAPIRLLSHDNRQQKTVSSRSRISHSVKRGESLQDIAEHYQVTLSHLRVTNRLHSNQLRVPVGTVLTIP